MKENHYAAIQDYGIIGNCKTTALVHKEGAIDFYCYPNFDSPSIFAKLLDHKKGGSFNMRVKGNIERSKQHYILDTNVLITRFFSENAVLEFLDFMPLGNDEKNQNQVIRIIKAVRGTSELELKLDLRPDYGRENIHISSASPTELVGTWPSDEVGNIHVKSTIELFDENEKLCDTFFLKENETAVFVLGDAIEDHTDLHGRSRELLEHTIAYWKQWIKNCTYKGDFPEAVKRSALTLKLLTSSEFGSTVAAATFSLPEKIGGSRNYDYRYTWIRDAAFSMYAFMRMGFFGESKHFMIWIEKCIDQSLSDKVELQIMYKIDGAKKLSEQEIPLAGYKNSSPVRIGNEASEQLQLDIFGELMDTIYLFDKYGEPITFTYWQKLEKLLDFVCKNWNTPDHGIWEVREVKRHYLYTRVMCWVALGRAIRLVRKRSLPTDLERWTKNRNLIHEDIYTNFWNKELNSFVHFKGAKTVDSSLLLLPLVRFISPRDEKWKSTMKTIDDQLVTDVLVYRNMADEIPVTTKEEEEETFLVGAFWYVECLARGGELKKAKYQFEKLLNYGNHLGLFAEEMSPSGMQLGNFPQAFTHLGLISAAFSLYRSEWNPPD